jgi:hypothetical protein
MQDGKSLSLPAMEARFAAIVADATKRYSDASNRSLDDYLSPPMKSVDDLKKVLDLQNEKFKQFRAKRHHIYSALSSALQPIEIIGDITTGAAMEVFAPSQSIFSAVMYLIGAAHNVSSMYDNIIDLFDQLKVIREPVPLPSNPQSLANSNRTLRQG